MIYLASVYSLNADAALREERYEYALKWLADFSCQGICVFSPVVHSHDMGIKHNLPSTFDFWEQLDYSYMDACEALYVLQMDGYQDSKGVSAEIKYAQKIGLPITYIACLDSPPAYSIQQEAA